MSLSPQVRDADTHLIERARSGDTEAVTELYRRHERRVYNLALRTLGNPWDAADVAQEAFIKAFRNLQLLQGRRPLHHLAPPHRGQRRLRPSAQATSRAHGRRDPRGDLRPGRRGRGRGLRPRRHRPGHRRSLRPAARRSHEPARGIPVRRGALRPPRLPVRRSRRDPRGARGDHQVAHLPRPGGAGGGFDQGGLRRPGRAEPRFPATASHRRVQQGNVEDDDQGRPTRRRLDRDSRRLSRWAARPGDKTGGRGPSLRLSRVRRPAAQAAVRRSRSSRKPSWPTRPRTSNTAPSARSIFPSPGAEPVVQPAEEKKVYRTPRWYRAFRAWIPATVAVCALIAAVVGYGIARSNSGVERRLRFPSASPPPFPPAAQPPRRRRRSWEKPAPPARPGP